MSQAEIFQQMQERQRALDNTPCPKCGGDLLRADFTENPLCHAPIPTLDISEHLRAKVHDEDLTEDQVAVLAAASFALPEANQKLREIRAACKRLSEAGDTTEP